MNDISINKEEIASILRPVAPPIVLDKVHDDGVYDRLMNVVRTQGPWPLVVAHHFKTGQELMAAMSGTIDDDTSIEQFLEPGFRGYLADNGVCYFREMEPVFYNSKLLDHVRSYWGAQYAQPTMMLFNINGSLNNGDRGHLDGVSFRGIHRGNTPLWILNFMGKSGLFRDHLAKMGQVLSWWYAGTEGGGFTYWPDGPLQRPQRLVPPMWNRGVVSQNEMMFHRGESVGPMHRRVRPQGMALHSKFSADPDDRNAWLIKTDDKVLERVASEELRVLLHWNAEVFYDLDDLKRHADHTDDLTHERVFETFIADLHRRGFSFDIPSDPLYDTGFMALLAEAYDVGLPAD